jgi:hypothetical protein
MKKRLLLVLLAGVSLTGVYAQNVKKKKGGEVTQKEVPKPLAGLPLSWGERVLQEAEKISAPLFQALMQKPLSVTTGAGLVQGFAFTYAERALYEDSVGNPLILTDYMTEYCFGDTLSKNIKLLLPSRVKAGDTVYIANVKVQPAEGKTVLGRSTRIVIIP